MSMPRWLILVLRWGGTALAVVAAAALIYVELLMPTAEEAPVETMTPVTFYWVLLVVGAIMAVIGFITATDTPEGEA